MKAADAQEKVQVTAWRVAEEIRLYPETHENKAAPEPGSPEFRREILAKIFTPAELKQGSTNFLFTDTDNYLVVKDLWQIAYFGLSGKVPLTRLENALGKVSKKDLGKKSATAMVCQGDLPAAVEVANRDRDCARLGGGWSTA